MQSLIDKSKSLLQKNIIDRIRYYDRLDSLLQTNQIIVVQGQRRVGKSSIVMGYLKNLNIKSDSIFFLNKEVDITDEIKSYIELSKLYDDFVSQKGEPDFIFIDEIQDISQRERFVRAKFAEGNKKIIISGSNANLLSTDLATYLTGRYISLEVFPLDYLEYLDFSQQKHSDKIFLEYMRRGGLPELAFIKNQVEKESYLASVLNTILFKDIVMRFSIKEPGYLQKILSYISDIIGSSVSLRNIKNASKEYGWNISSLTTLSNYISYLELPYLIYKVPRFDIQGKKLFEYNEKYYFNDLGIRNNLKVYMEADIGKILENLVYLHIRKMGYNVFVGNIQNKEIDFIAQKGNDILYIQVAYLIPDDKTRDREFGNLLNIKDAYPKMVVSTDPLANGMHMGIKRINIYDFIQTFK